jgi:hypothetical protein
MSRPSTRPALLVMISLTKGSACAEAKKSRTKARKRHQFYYSSAKLQLFPPSKGKIPKQHKKMEQKKQTAKTALPFNWPAHFVFYKQGLKNFSCGLKKFSCGLNEKISAETLR